ncbi:hypothetical protein FRC06_004515 [Ceratobasidium sp. 370]|nr:hypothetical protein FRC06_004515 [Ceratobasidium sp. 370]
MSQVEESPTGPHVGGPSSDTGTATYDQARQRLRSARNILSHAVQEYLSASQFIQTTCSATVQFPNEPLAAREQALLAIDTELSTLLLEETGIQRARNILTDTRNRSKPIYSLPSEILAHIFSEAACSCTHVTTYDPLPPVLSPVALSAVCKQWRDVAANHRSLWTHLDLDVHRSYTGSEWYPGKIWVERSQGAPLFVNIRQYAMSGNGHPTTVYDDPDPSSVIMRLFAFLIPLTCQVSSLTVILGWPQAYIAKKLLDCWATYGFPPQVKFLKLESNPEFGLSEIIPPVIIRPLESLEVLHAYNTVPPWSGWTIGNLVDLRLEADLQDEYWSMTQTELVSVLSSCPKLRYLTLSGLEIQGSWEPVPSPVALDELRDLNIGCIYTGVLVSVLDSINPGDAELRLEIDLFYTCVDPHEAIPAVCRFADRWNIETLRWACYGEPCFASQLGPLPHVRTLALNLCYFSDVARVPGADQDLKTYVNPLPTSSQTMLWPDLQELRLHNCTLEKEHLYRLISLHSIQTLYMLGCYHDQQAKGKSGLGRQARQEYVQLLSGVVAGDCIVWR